jgi:hypothetical protein
MDSTAMVAASAELTTAVQNCTATLDGLFLRSSSHLQLLSAFGGSSKIAAWCDANDPYCADGVDLTVHLTYLDRYQDAAADFVLGKIGG